MLRLVNLTSMFLLTTSAFAQELPNNTSDEVISAMAKYGERVEICNTKKNRIIGKIDNSWFNSLPVELKKAAILKVGQSALEQCSEKEEYDVVLALYDQAKKSGDIEALSAFIELHRTWHSPEMQQDLDKLEGENFRQFGESEIFNTPFDILGTVEALELIEQ